MYKDIKGTVDRACGALAGEDGMALVITLLIMVLVTSLGIAAIMMGGMDSSLTKNFRDQKAGEAAANAGIELALAKIAKGEIQLPVGVSMSNWTGPAPFVYNDGDLDLVFKIHYKKKDTINYFEGYTADDVVRYGKNYQYANAKKDEGRQAVYTVEVTDNKTGAKAEADLISSIGFTTPGALFSYSSIAIMKNYYASEEIIELTAPEGTPAIATTLPQGSNKTNSEVSNFSVFVQRVKSKTDSSGKTTDYVPNGGGFSSCDNVATSDSTVYNDPNSSYYPEYNPLLYTFAQISTAATAAAIAAGDATGTDWEDDTWYKRMHIRLRSGHLFNPRLVVKFDYPRDKNLEGMIGTTFEDLRAVADIVFDGNAATDPDGSSGTMTDPAFTNYNFRTTSKYGWPDSTTKGITLSTTMNLGTEDDPKVIFFDSNMNLAGAYTTGGTKRAPLALVLPSDNVTISGAGILIVNGDLVVTGRFNWTGLMLIRGSLRFDPFAGGTGSNRSDKNLACQWKGFIMCGRNMDMWTFYGGALKLGFPGVDDLKSVQKIIAASIPKKTLNYRRIYH